MTVCVLIESDWNLKTNSLILSTIFIFVLIESDWNLKSFVTTHTLNFTSRINRIRLEFKGHAVSL